MPVFWTRWVACSAPHCTLALVVVGLILIWFNLFVFIISFFCHLQVMSQWCTGEELAETETEIIEVSGWRRNRGVFVLLEGQEKEEVVIFDVSSHNNNNKPTIVD